MPRGIFSLLILLMCSIYFSIPPELQLVLHGTGIERTTIVTKFAIQRYNLLSQVIQYEILLEEKKEIRI